MADVKRGMRRNLTAYGDEEFSLFLRRAFIKAMGYTDDALERPIIGITNTYSGFNACHRTVPELIDSVKRGVMLAGGLPVEFPTITLHAFDRMGRETPVLVDLKPTGQHYMEDLYNAGGLATILRELGPLMHGDARTVTGRTLGEELADARGPRQQTVVRSRAAPVYREGGIAVLRGNLAPDGAIIKQSAASENLMRRTGRAVVFESLEDLAMRIDDPALDVEAGTCWCSRTPARKARRACRKPATYRYRASSRSRVSKTWCVSPMRA